VGFEISLLIAPHVERLQKIDANISGVKDE
jgi:hypothetical protein